MALVADSAVLPSDVNPGSDVDLFPWIHFLLVTDYEHPAHLISIQTLQRLKA